MAISPILDGKRIVLGVTGSIAAYKAAILASTLAQAGAIVDVIMTEAATKLVGPLTFQSVTKRPVHLDMWRLMEQPDITHVTLGVSADLLVVAPATANTIAKMANGLADDLLSTTALAVRCPIVVAPAMDAEMYEHPATQENVARLRSRGVVVIGPGADHLASPPARGHRKRSNYRGRTPRPDRDYSESFGRRLRSASFCRSAWCQSARVSLFSCRVVNRLVN